jgi:hypothetical protein
MPSAKARTHRRRDPLLTATVVFLAANLIHTADHFRQGTAGVRTAVIVGGTSLTISAFVALGMAMRSYRHTALFAAMLGFAAAVGISASHIAPDWGALSDSYPKIHADALSWAVMLFEVFTGLALGIVGLRELRRDAVPRTVATSR